MALTAVQSAMNLEPKSVHPFFSKPPNDHASDSPRTTSDVSTDNGHHAPECTGMDSKPSKGGKKKTTKSDGIKEKNFVSHAKNQVSLDRFTRPPLTQATSENIVDGISTATEVSLEVDPNHDRRKRRKTDSPEPLSNSSNPVQLQPPSLNWHQQLQVQMDGPAVLGSRPNILVHKDMAMTDISEAPWNNHKEHSNTSTGPSTPSLPACQESAVVPSEAMLEDPKNVTPKKQIKVTKSGRLVSSPPKQAADPISPPKKKRGRKPKAKVLPTVTVIKYGVDAASRSVIGQKIEEILNAKKKPIKSQASQKNVQPKSAVPPKVTHPFFLGKAQKDTPSVKVITELPSITPRKSAVTPGKLRAETRRDQSPELTSFYNRGLQTSKAGKQSGLIEPSWPAGENVHVRNLEATNLPWHLDNSTCIQLALRPRKMKNAIMTLLEHEDMVARLAQDISKAQGHRNNGRTVEFAPPEDVRLPIRLLTTGPEIKRRVCEQLLVEPLLTTNAKQPQMVRTAILDLLGEIEYTLTPFDEGRCETQSWTQKYAPRSSAHVLQTGTDAAVLKDWLESLTVMTVSGASKSTTAVDAKQPPRKKRKKALDDFIVPDDEEEEDMVRLPEVEGRSYTEPSSFRRPQWTRDKNVVLISGPHGCGKSATVHAVAKEMGFEVFEIHAGMRRSGKDIQDKVGDMTGNHLVNHKRNAASIQEPLQPVDEAEDGGVDTDIEKDISSGRQETMTSFFQAKPGAAAAKPKAQARLQGVKKALPSSTEAALPPAQSSRTSQKQSLILIEEADILFEEDQQFWAQITKIASLSKRPIVITCNDERQIPTHDLPLAAVLRLQPPPVELATDYLLVMAGREGHILERQAVKELYQSKACDLRASIVELDFWCQMSVGDRKGGLEWMYQRWPPGKDIDERGQTLRIASKNTYQSGMGWLSHNIFEASDNAAFDKEEELLQEIWTDWGISPSDWGAPAATRRQIPNPQSAEPARRMEELERLDAYAESLSATDIFCRIDLPSYGSDHDQPTDASQPPVPEKSRLSYTLAAPVLQIDHCADFLSFDTALATQTHLLLQRAYPEVTQERCFPSPSPSAATSESAYAQTILTRQHSKKMKTSLNRYDFAVALDCLAAPADQLLPERTTFTLTPSSFDRTFSLVTLDLAPYVRSIVAHEQTLEQQRSRMSDMLHSSGSGSGMKKARTTRASRVALEGGIRESKRRERWFDAHVDYDAVMRTAGRDWAGLGWKSVESDEVASLVGSERDGEFEYEDEDML